MGSAEGSTPAQRAGSEAGAQAPITIPRGAYVAASVMAFLLGAAATVRGTSGLRPQDSDLTTFFFPAADQILHGHPWMIYAVRAFGGYPNYNPPISIFLMAPLLALARALGAGATIGGEISFVAIPFIAFVLLLGYVTVVTLRRLFPSIPETQRFLAFVVIVFGPLTWQTFTIWYHIEQPMMLALLVAAFLAFQARREGLGGVLAGLAVLSRTTALIPLIGFGVLLLAGREWRALARFGGLAAAVTALGLAPFFLFDRADAMYSLVSWRGASEIGGNSIWSLVRYGGTHAQSPLRYALDHFARRLDMYTVILAVAVMAFLAVRQLRISAYGREAWAVLAIAALAVPMLSKNNWPYYYLEPFVFLLIWEFSSMHDRRAGVWRWPVLTFGYLSVAATLSQFIGLQSVGALDRVVVGLIEFTAMLAFAVAVWYRMGAGKVEPAIAASSNAAGGGARSPDGRQVLATPSLAGGWPANQRPSPAPMGQPGMQPGMGARPSAAPPYRPGNAGAYGAPARPGEGMAPPPSPPSPYGPNAPSRATPSGAGSWGGQPPQPGTPFWPGPAGAGQEPGPTPAPPPAQGGPWTEGQQPPFPSSPYPQQPPRWEGR